jgi:hypothetical protein
MSTKVCNYLNDNGLYCVDKDENLIIARTTDSSECDEHYLYNYIIQEIDGDNEQSWLIDDLEYLIKIMRGYQNDLRKWRKL